MLKLTGGRKNSSGMEVRQFNNIFRQWGSVESQTILTQNKTVSRKFEVRQSHLCSPLRLSLTRGLPGCFPSVFISLARYYNDRGRGISKSFASEIHKTMVLCISVCI